MTKRVFAAVAGAVMLFAGPTSLNAQTTAPATPPAAQPAEHEQPAVPEHPSWHGSVNLGFAFADGAQAQKGHQLDISVMRPFPRGGRFVGNLSREYQKVTFPSESLIADRLAAAAGVDLNVTDHTTVMVRSLYLRDKPLYVTSRFEQLAGYGVRLYPKTKRWELLLIPGISVFEQDLEYSDLKGWEAGWGFFQKFTGKLNAGWTVENSFRFRDNFTDVDRSIESTARLSGMITKTLGLQVAYQYNHESIVPEGFPEYLQVLSAGLRFQF